MEFKNKVYFNIRREMLKILTNEGDLNETIELTNE